MTSSQNMVLGYIPDDWDVNLERISVGNPEGSHTIEISFRFTDKGFELPDEIISADQDIWNENSQFWKTLAKSLKNYFPKISTNLNPKTLGCAYQIFTEEGNNYEGLELVANPSDGGEFENDNGKYNGKFYIKYEYEDEGEYFDERILIIQS
jgi:hypothetical protein